LNDPAATAVPAIVGSDARPLLVALEDLAASVEDSSDGAAGDIESLQPTTETERTTAERKPMLFFTTLSFVTFNLLTLEPAAPMWAPATDTLPPAARRPFKEQLLSIYSIVIW
jgi:hypothetical protein